LVESKLKIGYQHL